MPPVTVDSEDLFRIIKHCAELERDLGATRSAMTNLAHRLAGTPFAFQFASLVEAEKEMAAQVVMVTYQYAFDACRDACDVAATLKQLANWLDPLRRDKP